MVRVRVRVDEVCGATGSVGCAHLFGGMTWVVQKWIIAVLGSIAGAHGIRTTEHASLGKRDGG